jgi:hypothetical protein
LKLSCSAPVLQSVPAKSVALSSCGPLGNVTVMAWWLPRGLRGAGCGVYGAQILVTELQDEPDNTTRFLLLARRDE